MEAEVLLINDGSTDRSKQIAQSFEGIIIIDQKNQGVSKARNVGIENSRGQYIAFLDADDEFLPGNLQEKKGFLDQHAEIVLVHSLEKIVGQDGSLVNISNGKSGSVKGDLLNLKETVIHSPSSVMVRKEAIEKAGGFDLNLSTSADWDMWLRLSEIGEFGLIPEALVAYNLHDGQMHLNVKRMASDMRYAFRQARKRGAFSSAEEYRRLNSNLNFTIAASFAGDEKDPIRAFLYLFRSLVDSPGVFLRRIQKRY